jgi:NAD(P)-dependent dehydrogenase (short-subunit alcohol dehydrogenase family)
MCIWARFGFFVVEGGGMQAGETDIVAGSTSVIGLGIAAALARSGANTGRNKFGAADEIGRVVSDLKRQR